MQKMENSLAPSFWGHSKVIWSTKNNVRRPGCMLLLWNPVLIEAQLSFEGEGFDGIWAVWIRIIMYFVKYLFILWHPD